MQDPNADVKPELWPTETSEFMLICEVICKRNILLVSNYTGLTVSQLVEVDNPRNEDWENAYVFYSPHHYVAGVK